ncbi:MAG: hypothetical protein AVDCRST_MAG47-2476, partial [uncultured Nocardioidaceae bacterium]
DRSAQPPEEPHRRSTSAGRAAAGPRRAARRRGWPGGGALAALVRRPGRLVRRRRRHPRHDEIGAPGRRRRVAARPRQPADAARRGRHGFAPGAHPALCVPDLPAGPAGRRRLRRRRPGHGRARHRGARRVVRRVRPGHVRARRDACGAARDGHGVHRWRLRRGRLRRGRAPARCRTGGRAPPTDPGARARRRVRRSDHGPAHGGARGAPHRRRPRRALVRCRRGGRQPRARPHRRAAVPGPARRDRPERRAPRVDVPARVRVRLRRRDRRLTGRGDPRPGALGAGPRGPPERRLGSGMGDGPGRRARAGGRGGRVPRRPHGPDRFLPERGRPWPRWWRVRGRPPHDRRVVGRGLDRPRPDERRRHLLRGDAHDGGGRARDRRSARCAAGDLVDASSRRARRRASRAAGVAAGGASAGGSGGHHRARAPAAGHGEEHRPARARAQAARDQAARGQAARGQAARPEARGPRGRGHRGGSAARRARGAQGRRGRQGQRGRQGRQGDRGSV